MPSPSFTIDAKDYQKAIRGLEKRGWQATAGKNAVHAMRQILNIVRKNVRAELKPHNRTGRMRDNVRVRISGRGLESVGGVKSTGAGTNLIVGGVKPHPITAGGKVMPMFGGRGKRLTTKGGAAIEGFATAVEHPGFAADPFFSRALRLSEPQVPAILQASIDAIANEVADHMKRG